MSYVKHGFLADVYEPWVAYEGTEWGDQMRALRDAYGMGEDYAGLDSSELDAIEAILRRALALAHEDGWLVAADPYYAQEAKKVQAGYREIFERWDKQASSRRDRVEFDAAVELVPEWMKGEKT